MLHKSNKLQEEKLKANKIINDVVYRKMLWSKYIMCGMFVCNYKEKMTIFTNRHIHIYFHLHF